MRRPWILGLLSACAPAVSVGPEPASTTATVTSTGEAVTSLGAADAATTTTANSLTTTSSATSASTTGGPGSGGPPDAGCPDPDEHDLLGDPDGDGIDTLCDSCPLSSKTGAVEGENCCDPRIDTCSKWTPHANLWYGCNADTTGLRFDCKTTITGCTNIYRKTCLDSACWGAAICLPPGALLPKAGCHEDAFGCNCTDEDCLSKWCTVGDDLPCEAGMGCLAWFGVGEAPPGLQDLGVCARLDAGPCVGKLGRECAWPWWP